MNNIGPVAKILVLIGALNLGLVGVGGFLGRDLDVVNMVIGAWPVVVSVFYLLVGLSALYMIFAKK